MAGLLPVLVEPGSWGPEYRSARGPAPKFSTGRPAQSEAPPPAQERRRGKEPGAEPGGFVFHSDVQEVLLHATVIDDKQRMVTNLDKNAFTVFEDGKPQVIKSFRHEDIPISLGIVIDNSGSMREKRAKVNKAALNLVRASNPQDEVFVVNFSDEFFLDQPFTNKINLLQSALEKYETRGGTALYDAVVASADELKRHGKLQKKILFVVTDGEDDASRESLEQAVRQVAGREWPHGLLPSVCWATKGNGAPSAPCKPFPSAPEVSHFFPARWTKWTQISSTVARDIRNQYTIGYKPTTPKTAGGYRTIRVEARASGHGKLTVRTRSGYYAGQEQAAGGGN